MSPPFEFDRTWTFGVSAPELWSTLAQTDRYTQWWTWLRECRVGGDGAIVPGAVARCVVRAPLPYELRFEIAVERVLPEELVETHVRGDLRGPARLEVVPEGSRCRARLAWRLRLEDRMLRRLARFARPAMLWAHHRVVDLGLRQFERQALVRESS